MQCVDAETLAAWADGGLPKGEAAAVESHLADCERCTAMLATFVRTTPDAPAAESLWHKWHLRWLVPAATAATVATLWVLIPGSDSRLSQTSDGTLATRGLETLPSQPSSAVEEPKKEAADARTQPGPTAALEKRADAKASQPRQLEQRQTRDEVRKETQTFAPVPPTAAPAPAPAREADQANQRVETFQERAAAPAAPATAPPAAAAPTTTAQAPGDEALRAEAPRARTLDGSAARGFAALLEVVSPDPMTRWRVVGTGQVERSTSGGARWERATLPESATLTGGSSPSPSICWLVGRTGAIYVTTDGLRFSKVAFQDRTDFVSIQAQDGRRATVVTIDGRTMRTEDQGATWIRITP